MDNASWRNKPHQTLGHVAIWIMNWNLGSGSVQAMNSAIRYRSRKPHATSLASAC